MNNSKEKEYAELIDLTHDYDHDEETVNKSLKRANVKGYYLYKAVDRFNSGKSNALWLFFRKGKTPGS